MLAVSRQLKCIRVLRCFPTSLKCNLTTRLEPLEDHWKIIGWSLGDHWKIIRWSRQFVEGAPLSPKQDTFGLTETPHHLRRKHTLDVGWYLKQGHRQLFVCLQDSCACAFTISTVPGPSKLCWISSMGFDFHHQVMSTNYISLIIEKCRLQCGQYWV